MVGRLAIGNINERTDAAQESSAVAETQPPGVAAPAVFVVLASPAVVLAPSVGLFFTVPRGTHWDRKLEVERGSLSQVGGIRNRALVLVNTYIAFFKDTSLVAVIGVFDLLGTARAVVVDPRWFGSGVEVYFFAATIYFALCAALSAYSHHLERALATSGR